MLYLTVPMLFTSLVAMSLVHTLHLEWMAIRAALFCVAASMLLNGVAIPLRGPLGAAWVTVVTQSLWTVWVLARIVLHRLKVAPVQLAEVPA